MVTALFWLLATYVAYAAGYFLWRVAVIIWYGVRHRRIEPPPRQSVTQPTVLLLGDSTVESTGVDCWEDSCGGAISRLLPHCTFELIAKSGATVYDVCAQLNRAAQPHYPLIVIGVGANDIFWHRRFRQVEQDLHRLLTTAADRTDRILLFHCVNLGTLPLFPWPFNRIYTWRTRRLQELFERVAGTHAAVRYANFFRERPNDLMPLAVYCAPDGVHPSKSGYRAFGVMLERQGVFGDL